jgi:hypothetical protein
MTKKKRKKCIRKEESVAFQDTLQSKEIVAKIVSERKVHQNEGKSRR